MLSFLADLTDPARYRKRRDDDMQVAMDTRTALTVDRPYDLGVIGKVAVKGVHKALYSGQPDHPEVRNAVRFWVGRARRAHAIAMGREAVCEEFLIARQGEGFVGPLYARKEAT
jgi:hypothetical protein